MTFAAHLESFIYLKQAIIAHLFAFNVLLTLD